jgi:Spy/CpxP family protein refolding chaperone
MCFMVVRDAPSCGTPRCRRTLDKEESTMKQRMILGALAVGTLLVVAYAFAQGPGGGERAPGPAWPGGPAMHGAMMRRMISTRLDQALDRASVTPEQRVKIYAARDRVFAAFDAQQPHDLRARRDRMLALFEADTLSTAQLEAAHQQDEQQRQRVRAAFDQALVEVHDTLTPAQRKVVAEYVRTHGPIGRHGHGPGMLGPWGPPAPGGPAGMPGPGAGGMR